LHIEGHSTMFGTTLNYVTLRLIGEGPNSGDGAMEKGQNWILERGGATYTTSWGKFWLTVCIGDFFVHSGYLFLFHILIYGYNSLNETF
jgi:hypothetical protein